jgi:RNA-directed DNA polymerase
MVNGPEDPTLEPDLDSVKWDWVDWSGCNREVRRLRLRIFKATQEGDWPKVRSLQKLMLRSRSNTLLSVRQVTQRNAGRKTAGIDGEVALTSEARADVVCGCTPRSGPGYPPRSSACTYRRHQTVQS